MMANHIKYVFNSYFSLIPNCLPQFFRICLGSPQAQQQQQQRSDEAAEVIYRYKSKAKKPSGY